MRPEGPMSSEELSDERLTAADVARDILWRRDFNDPLASDSDVDDIERYAEQQVAARMKPFLDDHARTLESGAELVADLRATIATLERDLAAARKKLAEAQAKAWDEGYEARRLDEAVSRNPYAQPGTGERDKP